MNNVLNSEIITVKFKNVFNNEYINENVLFINPKSTNCVCLIIIEQNYLSSKNKNKFK